ARCGLEAVAGAHSGEKPVRLALGEPSVEIPGELCVAGIDPVCLPVAREDGRDATAGNIAGAAKLVQLGRVRYDPVDVAGAKGARQVAVACERADLGTRKRAARDLLEMAAAVDRDRRPVCALCRERR